MLLINMAFESVSAGNQPKTENPAQSVAKPAEVVKLPPERPEIQGFIRTAGGTGVELNRRNLPKTEKNDREKMKEEVKGQYETFLTRYLGTLISLQSKDATAFSQILASPDHIHDRELFALLTSVKEVGSGKSIREIDLEKVRSFLKKDSGMLITTKLLEHQTSLKMMALGLHAALIPEGQRTALAQPEFIRLGIDQGVLNRALTSPWMMEIINRLGGRTDRTAIFGQAIRNRWQQLMGLVGTGTAGYIAGSAIGGEPIVAAIGTAVGLGVPLAAHTINELFRSGVSLDIRQCQATLSAASAGEAAYIKAMLGVDTWDLVNNPATGRVELRPGQIRETGSIERLREEVLSGIFSRLEFYQSYTGIPMEQLDALPEQFLYAMTDLQPERVDDDLSRDIIERFKAFGNPDPNIAVNLTRFRQARAEVICRYVRQFAQENSDEFTSKGETASARRTAATRVIEGKINARKDTAESTRRTAEAAKRKTELTAKKDEVTTKQKTYEAWKNKQEEQRKAVEQATDLVAQLRKEFSTLLDLSPDLTNINAIFTEINTLLYDPANPDNGYRQKLSETKLNKQEMITQNLNKLYQARFDQINTLSPDAQRSVNVVDITADIIKTANATAEATYDIQIEELQKKVDRLTALKESLEKAQKAYSTCTTEITKAESEIINTAPKDLVETVAAYNQIIAAAGATVNTDQLRQFTVEQLIPFLIALPYNQPNGTVEQQAALRQLVIRAKTEMKAKDIETYETSPVDQIAAYDRVINSAGAVITANDLLTRTTEQLDIVLTQPPYNMVDETVRKQALQYAQIEARKRLRIRYEVSLGEQAKDLDERIKVTDSQINNKDVQKTIEAESARLKVTKDIMARQGQVFTLASLVTADSGRYFDTTAIGAADTTLTATERAQYNSAQLPRGYLELMNGFFNYQFASEADVSRNPDYGDRDKYFQTLLATLPPDKLAEILDKSLNLAISSPTINGVLTAIRVRIGAGVTSSLELQQAFRDVINKLRDEAVVI